MDLGNIRSRMEVVGSDGEHLGTVDRNRMRRLRNDPAPLEQRHWLAQDATASVDGSTTRRVVPASQARWSWQGEDAPPRGG